MLTAPHERDVKANVDDTFDPSDTFHFPAPAARSPGPTPKCPLDEVNYGTCLTMAMWSYCGRANLCILADDKIVSDGWQVYDDFVAELRELIASVPAQPGRQDPEARAAGAAQLEPI